MESPSENVTAAKTVSYQSSTKSMGGLILCGSGRAAAATPLMTRVVATIVRSAVVIDFILTDNLWIYPGDQQARGGRLRLEQDRGKWHWKYYRRQGQVCVANLYTTCEVLGSDSVAKSRRTAYCVLESVKMRFGCKKGLERSSRSPKSVGRPKNVENV